MDVTGLSVQEWQDGVTLKIKVQPRAGRNVVQGILGDALKVALTAAPVDGEANREVVDFIAQVFKVKTAQVKIQSGEKSRNKTVKIVGITRETCLMELAGMPKK